MVDPSDSRKAILKLAQYDPLRVEVVLPIALYGKIKIRDSAEVVPEAPIGGNYRTTVKLVDRVVDAASGTFGIRLEIANPAFTIPPGIKCNIKFPGLTL
jgi:Ethanolamine utilization protein EutJ (predicted chaperonin)